MVTARTHSALPDQLLAAASSTHLTLSTAQHSSTEGSSCTLSTLSQAKKCGAYWASIAQVRSPKASSPHQTVTMVIHTLSAKAQPPPQSRSKTMYTQKE